MEKKLEVEFCLKISLSFTKFSSKPQPKHNSVLISSLLTDEWIHWPPSILLRPCRWRKVNRASSNSPVTCCCRRCACAPLKVNAISYINWGFSKCKPQSKQVAYTVTLVFTGLWKQPGDTAYLKVCWITNWTWCKKNHTVAKIKTDTILTR